MNKMNKILFVVLCFGLVSSALIYPNSNTVFAHRMIVETVEDGLIHVRYDDGTDAPLAVVSIYDEDGKQLVEGEVDEDGYFYYDEEIDVHRIVADDGMGHRASSVSEEEESIVEKIPLFIRALLGVSVLLFIASTFYFRSNKKRSEELS
ncbi:hypothetical protein J2Z83_001570 [Virgibacillus natechei]|uniref:Uncharacterized protein n=1 Tax=Virgibacillus natechei TaxID=1216297 RepID=A0ABS4IES2_9BACI|nr:hypothetical protein [Virgibacillus natechei]MBP1969466.1 hypothetical protein [Virgibacillus natechei]UZD11828.1 hypothetical protein OLD84_12840 [Virgibacillus natechei]